MLSLILNIPWVDIFFQNNLHGSLTQRFNINSQAVVDESGAPEGGSYQESVPSQESEKNSL